MAYGLYGHVTPILVMLTLISDIELSPPLSCVDFIDDTTSENCFLWEDNLLDTIQTSQAKIVAIGASGKVAPNGMRGTMNGKTTFSIEDGI